MKRQFFTLDVFTEYRFCGNPLAVVLDSQGLDDAAMLAIAREFNLSETVFLSSPDDPIHSAKMRIFTPLKELPFAGHPAIGTAILLADRHAGGHIGHGIVVALEMPIGTVKVEVTRLANKVLRGVFELPNRSTLLPHIFDPLLVSRALGLDPLDLGFATHGLTAWDAGVPFVMVPVKNLAALNRVKVADFATWMEAFGATGKAAAYLYTRETINPDHHIHARMFFPAPNIIEDPATGSAAAAFSGVAATLELPEDGVHQLIIEQGFKMGRPSLIALDLHIRTGLLSTAFVGGSAVHVSNGVIEA